MEGKGREKNCRTPALTIISQVLIYNIKLITEVIFRQSSCNKDRKLLKPRVPALKNIQSVLSQQKTPCLYSLWGEELVCLATRDHISIS